MEINKDLEKQLGFSITAVQEEQGATKKSSTPLKNRPTTAASKRSYAVSGRSSGKSARPQTAGANRRTVAFQQIANKKQTNTLINSNSNSSTRSSRKSVASSSKRPKSAAPSRRSNRKDKKMSKTISGNRLKTASSGKRTKSSSKAKMNKTSSAVEESSLEGETPHEIVEKMRQKQTMHLLKVLEEEQQSEDKREKTLRSVKDPVERRRLDKVFAVERAKASERIVRITEDNELVLADKMAQLGLIR